MDVRSIDQTIWVPVILGAPAVAASAVLVFLIHQLAIFG
jgi:hypothetical protein